MPKEFDSTPTHCMGTLKELSKIVEELKAEAQRLTTNNENLRKQKQAVDIRRYLQLPTQTPSINNRIDGLATRPK